MVQRCHPSDIYYVSSRTKATDLIQWGPGIRDKNEKDKQRGRKKGPVATLFQGQGQDRISALLICLKRGVALMGNPGDSGLLFFPRLMNLGLLAGLLVRYGQGGGIYLVVNERKLYIVHIAVEDCINK